MTAFENKEIKEIMEELENCEKESMLMNMLIKTTVDSIIQNEVIYWSNQINAYRKSISLNMLNLPNEKLAPLANLSRSDARGMEELEKYVILTHWLCRSL